tara:strand:- start:288 stop:557 length:270 start_codon:yes stop_codon:yes gene_type:complete
MQTTLFLTISQGVFVWLAVVGFSTVSYLSYTLVKSIAYKVKHKEWPTTLAEKKYFYLLEENKKLKEKISYLEEELQDITKQIISNIKEA